MKIGGHIREGNDFWVGALCSVAIHAVVIVFLVVGFYAEDDEVDETERAVEVFLDEEPPMPQPEEALDEESLAMVEEEQLSLPQDPPPEEHLEEDEHEEEEEEEEEQQEQQEPEDTPLDRYAVDQITDDEEPDEADHLSDEAHRTEEETVAEITTIEDVEHHLDPEALEQEADTELEMAMQVPEEEFEVPDVVDIEEFDEEQIEDPVEEEAIEEKEEREEEEPVEEVAMEEPAESTPEMDYRDPAEMFVDPERERETPVIDEEVTDRETLFGRRASTAREVLKDDAEAREAAREKSRPQGRRLLANWRENEEAMRASLENFLPHVQPGNHTSVNARAAAHASYINRIHRSIHPKWAGSFIPRVSRNFSSRDPINDMNLMVIVEIVIDADSGEVVEVGRGRPSGNDLFDAEAMNIARAVGDQPDPPDSIISPDGNVYIHWRFWRDQRRCGTFGASIYRLQEEEERRQIQR